MSVRFFFLETDFKLTQKRILSHWIKQTIFSHLLKCGEITFIFTTNEKILEINKQYLRHDYFTDIITFNYNQDKLVSGDIYISIDTVKANAELYKTTFINELYRVMIHGILHLIGFNDKFKKEKVQMTENENLNLQILYSQFLNK